MEQQQDPIFVFEANAFGIQQLIRFYGNNNTAVKHRRILMITDGMRRLFSLVEALMLLRTKVIRFLIAFTVNESKDDPEQTPINTQTNEKSNDQATPKKADDPVDPIFKDSVEVMQIVKSSADDCYGILYRYDQGKTIPVEEGKQNVVVRLPVGTYLACDGSFVALE